MKILVAVDGSSYTKRMLAYLAAHDEWLGEQHSYTVLHVVPGVPMMAIQDKDLVNAYYDSCTDKVFKPLRTFFARHDLKVSFVGKVGKAAEVVAETATKGHFDLLLLGSHGHGSLAGLVLGSVATRVLAGCATPALVIR